MSARRLVRDASGNSHQIRRRCLWITSLKLDRLVAPRILHLMVSWCLVSNFSDIWILSLKMQTLYQLGSRTFTTVRWTFAISSHHCSPSCSWKYLREFSTNKKAWHNVRDFLLFCQLNIRKFKQRKLPKIWNNALTFGLQHEHGNVLCRSDKYCIPLFELCCVSGKVLR